MPETSRFEILLPPAQREALSTLAQEAGVSSSGLARLAINRMLTCNDLLLSGTPRAAGTGGVGTFISELRQSPGLQLAADMIEQELRRLDEAGDGSADAAGLFAALEAISRIKAPLVDRLRAMEQLFQVDGPVRVTIPRALVKQERPQS